VVPVPELMTKYPRPHKSAFPRKPLELRESLSLSQGRYRLCFGLGQNERVDSVKITGPNGQVEEISQPKGDQPCIVKQESWARGPSENQSETRLGTAGPMKRLAVRKLAEGSPLDRGHKNPPRRWRKVIMPQKSRWTPWEVHRRSFITSWFNDMYCFKHLSRVQ
jgi:hypothetical protein